MGSLLSPFLKMGVTHAGVDGYLWLTSANLYRDTETSVKWSSQVSEPFKVQQGVRQGGVLSARHYKLYNTIYFI